MQKQEVGNKGSEKREYPETLALKDGDTVVAIAVEQRTATTQYGERIVVESIVRGQSQDKTFTLWWPRKLPTPPLSTPFALTRKTKSDYALSVAETEDEMKTLWRDGVIQAQVADAPKSRVKAILDKLGS